MSKRPDSVETVVLAVELLRRIPRGTQRVTARQMHAQLTAVGIERDLRTIQRQLTMLCEHFGVHCDDRSKPYGYHFPATSSPFTISSLTPAESLLMTLAEQYLKPFMPPKLKKTLAGFFQETQRHLGPNSTDSLEKQWPEKVRVISGMQPLLPPKIADGVFDEVCDALYYNRWLEITYQNAQGHKGTHRIMPLGLAQLGSTSALYLACRFEGYDNERSIALHRIRSAKASSLTFERPTHFNLAKYDDDGRFIFGEGKKIRLRFCIDKMAGLHLLETRLSEDQQVKELAEHYQITATVVDSERLQRWLNSFGDSVSNIKKTKV